MSFLQFADFFLVAWKCWWLLEGHHWRGPSLPTEGWKERSIADLLQDWSVIQSIGQFGLYADVNIRCSTLPALKSPPSTTLTRSCKPSAQIIGKDDKLTPLLTIPALSNADKSAIINEVFKQVGGNASSSKVFKGLLETLAENNRLSLLPGIANKFDTLMGAHRGEVQVVVTTATVRDDLYLLCVGNTNRRT